MTIEENMTAHPEWYADPETIEPEVEKFLDWQSQQYFNLGPGTIGQAWESAGTGKYYKPHVAAAKAAISAHETLNVIRAQSGLPIVDPEWTKPFVPNPVWENGGAVFGGT